ncbi:hypothetical protein AeRB84_003896 [Aphanomyces euteiches]|nr:hypothetical protein AeRB84_003896 [Aphanomyces euteiches]
MTFYDNNPIGRVINRYAEDMASRLFGLAGSLITSAVVIQWFGLLFLPIAFIYVRLTMIHLQPSWELSRLTSITKSPVLNFLDEVEHGFTLLRAHGPTYIQQAVERHAHHLDMTQQTYFAKYMVDTWFELCIQLQGTAIVMVVASALVFFRPMLSAGMVGYSNLEIGMVAPERVMENCSLDQEKPNRARVQLRYKPTGELVLKDITCFIHGGEKNGIVGHISTIPTKELRRQLSIIPQSPVLFKGTLRQYLDPFGSFDDAALWSVVSKAGLHTLVSEMPNKFSTELADKGSNLSVGERQMLCLVRALLVQSKIVVLDEATAAMDHETDVKLQRVIAEEFANATVLTIAHRLHTIMNSDRIMVMDAGRVVEFDSPSALMAKEDGTFYRLAKDGGVLSA